MSGVAPSQLNYLNLAITGLGSTTNSSGSLAFRPKEIYGWAFPIVTGKKHLTCSSQSQIDWTQMFLRYSEPEYVRDLTTGQLGQRVGVRCASISSTTATRTVCCTRADVNNVLDVAGSYIGAVPQHVAAVLGVRRRLPHVACRPPARAR